jgi:hypothetical protein
MKTLIPLIIFPIEGDGFHIKLNIKINRQEATMILDTGASRTVFDENRIVDFIGDDLLEDHDRLSTGLGTTTMASKKVMIKIIQLGKLDISNYQATILDLQHVNQSYEKLELDPIDGVLGGDILYDYNAVIDYSKKKLILNK